MPSYLGTPAGWRTLTSTAIHREHLLDVVTMISPTRTPIFSTLPKSVARNMTVEWITDMLASEGDPDNGNADVQAISEDTDASFTEEVGPYRLHNRIHIFRETLSVTDKLLYVEVVDTEDAYATILHKRIKEQAKKIEYALIHSIGAAPVGSGNAPSPGGVAPQMFGLQQVAKHTGFGGEGDWDGLPAALQGTWHNLLESPAKHLLETHVGDMLSDMSDKGAEPTDIWCAVNQKRQIADFSGASTRLIEAEDRALIHTIDVYEGPTGVIVVNLHRMVPKSEVLFTETGLLELAILKPCIAEHLARVGDAFKGMVETALTLIVRCPAAIGKITGLSETYSKVVETEAEEEA